MDFIKLKVTKWFNRLTISSKGLFKTQTLTTLFKTHTWILLSMTRLKRVTCKLKKGRISSKLSSKASRIFKIIYLRASYNF